MYDENKPSLEELAHYGVLGMKWGHRRAATGKQIKAARKHLKAKSTAYRKVSKQLDALPEGSAKRKQVENKLRVLHQAYLKNPDRVIAARMTRGEKWLSVISLSETPVGLATSVGQIATTSAVSRRIEQKQDTGAYNKIDMKAPVRKHLGLQKSRGLALAGTSLVPGLVKSLGAKASTAILQKATVNRAAAKLIKPQAIGSTAAKLKYAKVGLRGAHKITTMK